MNESLPPMSAPRVGVSRFRQTVSFGVLATVLVILAIELRAVIGHSKSVESLGTISEDGLFEQVSLATIGDHIHLAPAVSTVRENSDERVFRYRWFSLMRPLIGHPELEIYVVATPAERAQAMAFYTDAADAEAGFYGDKVPAEDAVEPFGPSSAADPFGIPDAPDQSELSRDPPRAENGFPRQQP